jgi:MFS family permease
MDPALLRPAPRAPREPGQLRSALRHVLATPALRIPLAMMAVVGTLSFNFQVLLPLLARFTWHGDASAYAALTAAMGIGSVAGALASGARGRVSPRLLTVAATAFGALMLLAAAAPTFPLQLLSLVPLGAMSVTFAAGVNSALQLAVAPELRGRVMALYSVVFLGSTPVGGPITGWLSEAAGPRAGLVLGGVAAIVVGIVARRAFARSGLVATDGVVAATADATARTPAAGVAALDAADPTAPVAVAVSGASDADPAASRTRRGLRRREAAGRHRAARAREARR